MILTDISWVGIIIAAVAYMIIGMIWYSPSVFGKQWMKLIGMSQAKMNKAKADGMGKTYAISFISNVIMAYFLAQIVSLTNAATFSNGLTVGFMMWLGFVATTSIGMILWEDKPLKLYVLNNGFGLVALSVMGGLLAIWG